MTQDQWKELEQSMAIAPEMTQEMFNAPHQEMTREESVSLARALLTAAERLEYYRQNINDRDLRDTIALSLQMMSGLYGRVMGLARAYDKCVTAQTVLEAELASVTK